jgi:RNA polymerase sigma-70 factor (ECF subfamily)
VGGAEERALTDRFVEAFTAQDVDALVALMTSDAWVRMPPLPFEYHGPEAAHRFFTALAAHQRQIVAMVPVGANGQPAWGEYMRDPVTGGLHLIGVLVIGIAGDRIHEIIHFETTVAAYFGLPRTLDS